MRFDTKIAVAVRDDLEPWQELNVTAFTVGGVAGTQPVIGEPYEDGKGATYLPLIRQPIVVLEADAPQLRAAFERARSRDVALAIYTAELFATGNDEDNRAAVRAVPTDELDLVGIAVYGRRGLVDKVMKGLALHR